MTIPESVTSIGDSAFQGCSSLASVTITEGVTSIGFSAFQGCSSLTSVTIPESVTSIEDSAFSGCSGLVEIVVEENNLQYASFEGVLYGKDMTKLLQCPGGKAGEVTIPDGVTSIEDCAFELCSSLTSVTIPESVTSIGGFAFDLCSSLTSVTIPEGVTSIGCCAFHGCSSLTSVTIPESVTSIGDSAFMACIGLVEIVVEENNLQYASFEGVLYGKDMTKLLQCPGGKAGEVTIPDGVTSIGFSAFMGCSGLTSVTIPEGVTSIGEGAFLGCTRLHAITFPESLEWIARFSFHCCSSLQFVRIPENTGIENAAFDHTCKLAVVTGSQGEQYAKNGEFTYRCENERFVNYDYKNGTEIVTKKIALGDMAEEPDIPIKEGYTFNGWYLDGNAYDFQKPVTADITLAASWKRNGSSEEEPKEECSHNYVSQIITPATCSEDGVRTHTCTICGKVESKTTIYAVKTINLSKTAYTYNGKAQKPSVTIKDSKGKALKKGTDYNVTYAKGLKDVGSYTVTISFKGNYSGTVKKTFTIVPKGTSITKLSAKSKGFAVKWKKQTSQTTGYEISYSTGSKFSKKDTKTLTVKGNKATSKSVSKLKAKKKYYVRIRTYKTVKVNGKFTKLYSGWSKTKTVTVKK